MQQYQDRREYFIRKAREWNLKNKDKVYEINQKHKQKTKKIIFWYLGYRCSECGFSDTRALQLDHIKSNGSEERKRFASHTSYYQFYYNKPQMVFDNLRLLCANCNWIKAVENKEFVNNTRLEN